ncbi:hypothetical protein ACOALA_13755 [Alicyclobacillus acidoterrestris]|uniref:hypothetical protein n=1 Tax=Alicyclobacillus TaxID=29330 RepID=UPI001A907AF0|nr:hypothetical protein [Alicyclobacillus suci]
MSLTSEQKQITKELTLAALPLLSLKRKPGQSEEDFNRYIAQQISETFQTIAQGIKQAGSSNGD